MFVLSGKEAAPEKDLKMFVFSGTTGTYTPIDLLEIHIVPQLLLYGS